MATVNLTGVVHSSLPLTLLWTRESGPATAVINSPTTAATTVTITEVGTYVFRLTADNGEDTAFDEVEITVTNNTAPTVGAGDDKTVTAGMLFGLEGSASDADDDDLTLLWTKESGPGTATITTPTSATSTASLSAAGTVVMRLTADDGEDTGFDEVTITVEELATPGTIYNSNTPANALSADAQCEYKVDLSTMSAGWWAAVNADASDVRVTLADGTLLPFDIIAFDQGAETGLLVFKHTAATTSVEYRVWAGHPTFAGLPATDPFGKDNAYRTDCLAFWPNGRGTDRTAFARVLSHNTVPSQSAGPIGALSSDYATNKYGIATLTPAKNLPLTVLGVTNKDPGANVCTLVGTVRTSGGTLSGSLNTLAAAIIDVASARTCRAFMSSATGNWGAQNAATTAETWRQYAARLTLSAGSFTLTSATTAGQTSGTYPSASFGGIDAHDRIVLGAYPKLTPNFNFLNGSLSLVAVYNSALTTNLIQYYEDMLDQSTFWGAWSEVTP